MSYKVSIGTELRIDGENYYSVEVSIANPLDPHRHKALMEAVEAIADICKPSVQEAVPITNGNES